MAVQICSIRLKTSQFLKEKSQNHTISKQFKYFITVKIYQEGIEFILLQVSHLAFKRDFVT